MTTTVKAMFDRSDNVVKAKHDIVRNVLVFGAIVYCFHKYGHKLAV
jgi:hypothetical protein